MLFFLHLEFWIFRQMKISKVLSDRARSWKSTIIEKADFAVSVRSCLSWFIILTKKILLCLFILNAAVADVKAARRFIIKVSTAFCFTSVVCCVLFDVCQRVCQCSSFQSSSCQPVSVQSIQVCLPDVCISSNWSVSRTSSTAKCSL